MSIDLTDAAVVHATASFYSDSSLSPSWLLLGYSPGRDRLVLISSGSDGVAGLADRIDGLLGDDVGYGLVRREGDGAVAFLTFVAEGAGGVKRARSLVHSRSVGSKLFTPHDAAFTITSGSELTAGLLDKELGGARASPSGQRSSPGPSGLVGGSHSPAPSSSPGPTSASDRPPLNHLRTLGVVTPVSSPRSYGSYGVGVGNNKDLPSPPVESDPRGNSSPIFSSSSGPSSPAQYASVSSDNPITRLHDLTLSAQSPPPPDQQTSPKSMGRPSIPLFSSLSILSKKGRRTVSGSNGGPTIPSKDGTSRSPSSPTSRNFANFPIGSIGKPPVDEIPVERVRGLDDGTGTGGSAFRRLRDSLTATKSVRHQPSHENGRTLSPPAGPHLDLDDAYDDPDRYSRPISHQPASSNAGSFSFPSTYISSPSSDLSPAPTTLRSSKFPASLSAAAPVSPVGPSDLYATRDFRGPLFTPTSPSSSSSQMSSSSPLSPHPSSIDRARAVSADRAGAFSTFASDPLPSRYRVPSNAARPDGWDATAGAAAGREEEGMTWLAKQHSRRASEDREVMDGATSRAVGVERDAQERKRARDEEMREEQRRKEEEREGRLRAARERTRALEVEEAEKRAREEGQAREREWLEKEREAKERERVTRELGRAREEGGLFADGWLTVQAPGAVAFRRRYFRLVPCRLELFKDVEDTVRSPLASIPLPPLAELQVSDAYEEIQVLHSFRLGSADGKTYLFYLDSEADKDLIIEALRVAASA